MNVMELQCPKCGNWVEGKKVDTLARKATRKVVRKGGMAATGAAIGTIVPGAGTLVGGIIGFAADILVDERLNDITNDVEQIFFNETDYEFRCPKCNRRWLKHDKQSVPQNTSHVHALSQNTAVTLNSSCSSNSFGSHSKNIYCFSLSEKYKLSITKYEFALALVEAKLAKNLINALSYYDAMPINLQAEMTEQEADIAKGILKRKCIPFQLQILQARNRQVNSNSETERTQEEREQQKFLKCFNDYLNNETEIIADLESAISFIDDVTKQSILIKNDVVRSEFFYLNSLCCLFYSKEHKKDSSLLERGSSFICRALSMLDDEEYRFVTLLYQSLLFDNNTPDVAARQRQIGNQCLSIQQMENSLLKPEYWQTVCNDLRFDSLMYSCIVLENRKAYREALLCWQQMHLLSDNHSQFVSTYFMFSYYYYDTVGIENDDRKAFEYANKVVSMCDFGNNFDQENLLHQYWQECLSEIGCMYKDGNGVEIDYQKAWTFLSNAAQLGGYSDSFIDLADMFENGLGVPKSLNQVIELYRQAADLNDEDAIDKLKELQSKFIGIASVISELQNVKKAEHKYIEMLKDCLEESNEISPRERRLLKKLQIMLNISDVRARKLEEQLSAPQLSEEEQEYLEEYKTCAKRWRDIPERAAVT